MIEGADTFHCLPQLVDSRHSGSGPIFCLIICVCISEAVGVEQAQDVNKSMPSSSASHAVPSPAIPPVECR